MNEKHIAMAKEAGFTGAAFRGMNMEYKILTKAGSCRSGSDRTGNIAHAILKGGNGNAVCGTYPQGKSAGWSSYESEKVTCPKCLSKLSKQALGE